jgi:two-component system chemotaxis response regulator CheY
LEWAGGIMQPINKDFEALLRPTRVLVIDDEHYTRKVIRGLLMSIGIQRIFEADDGMAGVEAIKSIVPDIVLLDWEMPGLGGADVMRIVRSPDTFPCPDVPIIMLTGHAERSIVMDAIRLGVHEYLLKPVSSQALLARILSIRAQPRPMVRRGLFYGPEPRKSFTYKPQFDPTHLAGIR